MVGRNTRVNLLIGTGHFLSHFYMLCLPPLFIRWQSAFGVSFAQLGLVVAVMSGITALLQTPVGFLVDRHGARRFLVSGTLLMALSISGMALATSYWQLLVLALLSGIGNSVIHPADYAILSGSVSKERMGRSFALHTFSGNLGFAAAPPVITALSLAMGWRSALLLVGLLGVPVVGAILWQSRILHDQARPRHAQDAAHVPGHKLLLTRAMLLFLGFYVLSSMAGAGIQSWLITVLHEVNGLDLAIASTALTGYMAANSCGTLFGGWMADRWTKHLLAAVVIQTVISAGFIASVGVVPMGGLAVIGAMVLGGALMGASRTPRDVMVKDAAPPGQIGKVFGFVSAGLPLGSALTPVPFGFLIDHGHSNLVLLLVAVLLLASLLCMGGAKVSAGVEVVPKAAE